MTATKLPFTGRSLPDANNIFLALFFIVVVVISHNDHAMATATGSIMAQDDIPEKPHYPANYTFRNSTFGVPCLPICWCGTEGCDVIQ